MPRRVIRSFALGTSLAVALAVVGPLAAAGAAGGEKEAFATLKVTAESVSVKAKGEDDFKKAADGDEVHAGDTVRTDATGKATIRYGDEAYTRLDVDTTFKITKLTDDEGNRQVQGTIESGNTWNRTTALTESESFEQTGADATAAVEGTAYGIECDTEDHCVFTGVVDDVTLTGTDGQKLVAPLDQCDSTAGVLCADITKLTPDQLSAWIIENLLLDVAEGFPWPFGTGTLQIAGESIVFVPSTPAATPPSLAVDAIACLFGCNQTGSFSESVAVTDLPPDFVPGSSISVFEDGYVDFVINLLANPTGQPVFVVFTALPDDLGETFYYDGDCNCTQVVVNTPYELVDDYMLTFVPYCYSYYLCGESTDVGSTDVPVNTNYVFFVTNDPNGTDPAQASQPVTVPVTVEYDPCGYSEEGVEAAC
jgi:hypothetical protein